MTLLDQIISKCHTVSMLDKGVNQFTLRKDNKRAKRCLECRDKTLEELEELYIEKFKILWWWK